MEEVQNLEFLHEGEIVVFEPSKMLNVPSATVHIENDLTLVQKKLWFELIYKAFPKMGKQKKYSIKLSELKELIGWKDLSGNDEKFKDALYGLSKTAIKWNIFGKDKKRAWQAFPLLAGCEIPENTGTCIFEFSSFLEERFLAMGEEAYVKIDLIVSKKFQSKYSLSIYCLALDYLMLEMGYSEKKFSIPELRRYLALKEGEYKQINDFSKRIIKPSEEEINTTSDMNISIEPFKDGRKIAGYKLCISLKEGRREEYLDRKNRFKELTAPNKEEKKLLEASKKESIQINGNELKKFFAKYNISITTDSFQEKLKELIELFDKDDLENYLNFLRRYAEQEYEKGSIKNFAGFFVSLFKDNNQIDNYLTYQAEIKQKEQEKNSVLEKYLKLELETKYESFLSSDFQEYVLSNIDKLSDKITQLVENHITKGSFVYDTVIKIKMEGLFSVEKFKKLSKSQQLMFFADFKKHKSYFNYHPLSFSEWRAKHVNKEELELIKESLKNKI